MPELMLLLARRSNLRWRGCCIGKMTVVSPLVLRGSPSTLEIGDGSIIGRVEIHLLDRVTIGANAVVNDGVKLLTGSHDVHCIDYKHETKEITIGDYAWVATDAIILLGVTIGRGAVVGAGAVVSRDVSAGSIVAGNPAKVVGRRDHTELRYMPSRNSAVMEAWLGKTDSGT